MINLNLYYNLKLAYCKLITKRIQDKKLSDNLRVFFEEVPIEQFSSVKFEDFSKFQQKCDSVITKYSLDVSEIKDFINYKKILPKNIKDLIFNKLEVKICPYCDSNKLRTTIYRKDLKSFKTRNSYQLDHLLSQNNYSFLVLAFENLIPCCQPCNHFKSVKKDKVDHPFLEPNSGPSLEFEEVSLIKNFYRIGSCRIRLNYKDDKSDFFLIKDSLEQNSQFELQELVLKKRIFTDNHLNFIKKKYEGILHRNDLKDVIFGGSINVFGSSQKVLSRITSNLIEDLDMPDYTFDN